MNSVIILAITVLDSKSEKVFASQERVSGFPEKGTDLRGKSGKLPEKSGELPGKSGKLPGKAGKLLSSTARLSVRELPGKSPKNFRGSLGNFWGSLETFQKLGGA